MSDRFIDLSGQRFTRLVVLKRLPNRITRGGASKVSWECLCDCGNTVTVDSASLRVGKTRSCGCWSRDRAAGVTDHLVIGKRFGRLVVLARQGSKHGAASYLCECDCGRRVVTAGSRLRRGLVQSCGCLNIERASAAKVKEVVKYLGAHDRIVKARGRAREHACVDCGGQARDWSYKGGDPDELHENVRGSVLAYSLDLVYYEPRCSRCHRRYDVGQRGGAA